MSKRRKRPQRNFDAHRRSLAFERLEDRRLLAVIGNNLAVGDEMRNYRLAVAATAEYTSSIGGQATAWAAIQMFVGELNEIYEPELAIHLDLVSDTNTIFTNATADGYSNGNLNAMLSENTPILDSILGDGGYDIGHVFGTTASGAAGLAGLGVVGHSGQKGRGVSLSSDPQGLRLLGLAGHEIGHQFGAEHTFNSNSVGCVQYRAGDNAYEVASGSTIMSFAGNCEDDLQAAEDLVFHAASFEQIQTHINGTPAAAPYSVISHGNRVPTVSGGPDFTIPANTPFQLTASGSDPDTTDTLSYTWDELDLGPAMSLPLSDNGSSPLFRSFAPTTNAIRVFPRLPDLLSHVSTAVLGETLPTASRNLNFRVTVRDGRGGIDSDDVLLQTVNTGAAFQWTTPNTAVTWTGASSETVTWNVAGTTDYGINAASVDIFLSTDGGQSFPFALATTDNDGAHGLAIPNINTTQARLRIQGHGNIFFDVSDEDFTIAANPAEPGVTLKQADLATRPVEGGSMDSYQLSLNTAPDGSVTLRVAADDQTQISTDGSSFAMIQTLSLDSTTPHTIYVRAVNDTAEEGPHTSTITHSIVAGTSANYPIGMLIDNLVADITDDELPPLIGLDFDCCGEAAPTNWSQKTFTNEDLSDMPRDDGLATMVDLDLTAYGSFNAGTNSPPAEYVPRHNPSLLDLGGFTTSTQTVTAQWQSLTPGQPYGVYVFGFERRSGEYRQTVSIAGQTALPDFTQTLSDGQLLVNDEVGSDARTLKSFEHVVAADSSGRITITITPNAGSAGIALAGLAIREVVGPTDQDADGVSDAVEDNGPNNGDGNSDGIPDSIQNDVATLPNAVDGQYATLTVPADAKLFDVQAIIPPSADDAPASVTLPLGSFGYNVSHLPVDGKVIVTVKWHSPSAITSYLKYGPTSEHATPHWYPFLYDGKTGARIFADRAEVYFVDGLRGDNDLTANGTITAFGSPGTSEHPWQNPIWPEDVNNDSIVSALDVLALINEINTNDVRELASVLSGNQMLPPFWDVNGDDAITPEDVLDVINFVNAAATPSTNGAEGETGTSQLAPVAVAMLTRNVPALSAQITYNNRSRAGAFVDAFHRSPRANARTGQSGARRHVSRFAEVSVQNQVEPLTHAKLLMRPRSWQALSQPPFDEHSLDDSLIDTIMADLDESSF